MPLYRTNRAWTVRELRQALAGLNNTHPVTIRWSTTDFTGPHEEFQITADAVEVEILIGYAGSESLRQT